MGMKNKKAFTLIELLVVVLIVAILAAIALPKYQLAVEKARTGGALTKIKSLNGAIERYVLTTGSYPSTNCPWSSLDIQLLDSCADGNYCTSGDWSYYVSANTGDVMANRYPANTKYYIRYISSTKTYRCYVKVGQSNEEFYTKVCENLCGTSVSGGVCTMP